MDIDTMAAILKGAARAGVECQARTLYYQAESGASASTFAVAFRSIGQSYLGCTFAAFRDAADSTELTELRIHKAKDDEETTYDEDSPEPGPKEYPILDALRAMRLTAESEWVVIY